MRVHALLVCLVMAACGDDSGVNMLPDAPPTDGLPDTPDPPQPVTLTITQNGEPVEGVDVFFQNPDSSLVAKVVTDANGVASATIDTGGYVTALDPFARAVQTGAAPPSELRTFAGVKPGDNLRLNNTMRATFEFVNVSTNIDNGAFSYRLFSTCMVNMPWADMAIGSGASEPTVGFDVANCTNNQMDIVVTTDQGSGAGNYFYEENVPVMTADTIDLDEAYTEMPDWAVRFENVPAPYDRIIFDHVVANARGPLFRTDSTLSVVSGVAMGTLKKPEIPNSTSVWSASPFPRDGMGQQTVLDWKPADQGQTYDLANAFLRAFTGAPTYDVAARRMTWTEATTGLAPDLAVVYVAVLREGDGTRWEWQLAGVPAGAAVQFPTLPPEIERFNVLASDTVLAPGEGSLTTAKVPGGYDAVRANVLSIQDPARDLVIGPTGRVSFQMWVEPPIVKAREHRSTLRPRDIYSR